MFFSQKAKLQPKKSILAHDDMYCRHGAKVQAAADYFSPSESANQQLPGNKLRAD